MPDWQERITDDTRPAVRAEHELRYALAAPLIRASARWCDLGCGTGLGAVAALGDAAYDGSALLVDREQAVADRAAAAVQARETVALVADLSDQAGVSRVREALATPPKTSARARRAAAGSGPGVSLLVTCFETIEHLSDFAPLVALLVELAARPATTVLLSVPNDAFWSVENPHHQTTWGEGAVRELRTLLPADHVMLHQVALQGSAIVVAGTSADVAAEVALAPAVPSHVLLAFGAGAGQLGGPATRVVQADVEAQRRWERQRESDLLFYETSVRALEQRLAAAGASAGAAPQDGDADSAPAANGHA
ncbi:methyltransferase domain-containing protein [Conexibacter sp. CPCC 206217]|uniref:methyltransferase domain-containing protein n=1 Tax=Conexibacter sp. CPCC 206217 TaxID=3064574 RepID=UPI00271CF874|nr:methyltransferase domain-containing protein [Conexibacter sp. CPCC 206217]MDO8210004.1 hypothetical protein [Conexibacter sp. CPCC 206217]